MESFQTINSRRKDLVFVEPELLLTFLLLSFQLSTSSNKPEVGTSLLSTFTVFEIQKCTQIPPPVPETEHRQPYSSKTERRCYSNTTDVYEGLFETLKVLQSEYSIQYPALIRDRDLLRVQTKYLYWLRRAIPEAPVNFSAVKRERVFPQ